MNMFRREKKKAGGHRCPVCGFAYQHAGMAERCTRTALCRRYNMPPAAVRDVWRLLGGAAYMGGFFAHPVAEADETEPEWRQAAERVDAAERIVFGYLHRACPVGEHVRRDMHRVVMGTAAGIWTPGEYAHLAFVGDVAMSVILDTFFEAEKRGLADSALAAMRDLEAAVERLYGLLTLDEASYEEDTIAAIERLERVVIGIAPEQRGPSLYVVNGRLLVAARGRAEVRKVMMGYGLSRPTIRGVAPGEKFADGRTAADLVALAETVPSHIGRLEE